LNRVSDYLYMIMTILSLPQYANTYKFLINVNKHDLQTVYELNEVGEAITQTNTLFTDFVNKLEIWKDLETQYESKQDA